MARTKKYCTYRGSELVEVHLVAETERVGSEPTDTFREAFTDCLCIIFQPRSIYEDI